MTQSICIPQIPPVRNPSESQVYILIDVSKHRHTEIPPLRILGSLRYLCTYGCLKASYTSDTSTLDPRLARYYTLIDDSEHRHTTDSPS